MSQVYDSKTDAQTDTVLSAAPGAGKQIVVRSLFVSSGGAQTISLSSGPLVATASVTNIDRGTSTGGDFVLTIDGETTDAIAFDDNGAAVKGHVEGLDSITTVTFTGTGTVGDPWILTITDPKTANVVTGDGGGLTGGDSTLTVTTGTPGEALGEVRWISYLAAAANESWAGSAPGGYLFKCGVNLPLEYTSTSADDLFITADVGVRTFSVE